MATPSPSVALPAAALGAAAVWMPGQLLQAFVPPAAPRAPAPLGAVAGGAGGAAAAAASATATAASSIAAGVLAAGAAAVASSAPTGSRRSQRSWTARCAEQAAFAGGLVGGESAFGSFDYNFDPLGLAEKCPQFLPWFREAELKHGRVAMMAWVGLVFPEVARIPGPSGCYAASVVDAHNACVGDNNLGPLFQVFMFCGLAEMLSTFPKCVQGLTLENAGDYRLGLNFL
eukprot:CAMPEP_0179053532 /NCGR_PEP_ID=MMETSP0796-20121207/22322_1 /TAXON_ID=73915 /ORGANISM="Pyrodinium bahamense, Strain pbaha01" /LENGTH=229 /DNA_ID=CAMNT_0020750133 /DNA_START=37 /DNA_END=723 /DNA_ORIENTATION=-